MQHPVKRSVSQATLVAHHKKELLDVMQAFNQNHACHGITRAGSDQPTANSGLG